MPRKPKAGSINQLRLAAAARGDIRFDPGVPCQHGHHSERYTDTGRCVTCRRISERERARRKSREG